MKEEEEDRVLLSSLGVTSANPEVIERHILAKVHMHGLNMCLGSISVSMLLHETSFCFVCSHLTSGLKEGDELRRNSDVMEILNKTRFSRVHSLGDEESPETILQHSFHLWRRHHRNDKPFRNTSLLHLQTLQIRKAKREATTQAAPHPPAQQWIHQWTAAQQKTLQLKKISTAPTTTNSELLPSASNLPNLLA